jgi:predicted RNase H-related nuclease YkuK (DUF458 family)
MPKHTSPETVGDFIRQHADKKFDHLPTDAQVLLELIVLVTDIKYRAKYGESYLRNNNDKDQSPSRPNTSR